MKENLLKIWNVEWIHLVNPSKEEVEKLVEKYDFHDIIAEDLIDINTQDKLDIYDDYIFLVLHFPKYDRNTQKYYLNEFDFILGKNFIISVSRYPSSHIYKIRKQYEEELKNEKDIEEYQFKSAPYYILYKILDAMYDKTVNLLNKFTKDLLEIEEDIFNKPLEEKLLEKLMIKKRNAIILKHIYKPQVEIISDLSTEIKNFYKKFEDEVDVYFEDIEYKIEKIINQIEIVFENIDNLTDIYNSLVSMKINKVMTLLTVFTAIIWIHTLIAWLYGMNVPLPLEKNVFTFWYILILIVLITIIFLYLFKRKRRI